MALIALIGLPGYYLSVCAMDRLGRRFIQLQVAHAPMHMHVHMHMHMHMHMHCV
jgi:hypothetical protein